MTGGGDLMGQIRMRVDDSELDALQADLRDVPGELMSQVRKAAERSAGRVKRGWAKRWEGHPDIKHLPQAITEDVRVEPHEVEAEIGPELHSPQGPLAHLIEFGTLRSPPIPGGQPALDEEERRYVVAVEQAGLNALRAIKERHGR